MKKKIILGVLVLILLIIGLILIVPKSTAPKTPNNIMVMYGYDSYDQYIEQRPEYYTKIDTELIDRVMSSGTVKNKQEAAQLACDHGMDYSNKGDKETAIKRFNHAWLLDNNHPCVYANYGYHYAFVENNVDKSFEMYEKALSLSSEKDSWWILTDYAEVLGYCYAMDEKRTDCLEKALDNLVQSLVIKNAPKTHRTLAIVHYNQKEYLKSWEQVHLAIDGGISLKVMSGLIAELKKWVPDPKGKY